MSVITLRNIPRELQVVIEKKADTEGLSLNKAVQKLLAESLGLEGGRGRQLFDDLDHLAGSWSAEEAAEFDAVLREERKIDPEIWE